MLGLMSATIPNLPAIVVMLEDIKRRKGMFFGERAEDGEMFLSGFFVALIATGVPMTWDSWRATIERRGWDWDSCGFLPGMKAKGLDDEEILNELIDSLVDELRHFASAEVGT